MKKEFLSIVKAIAPQLAMSLIPGGPFVKMGIKVLSETLLGKPDGTEAEVEAYLEKATPEELVKLKEAEARIKALDVDLEKVHADDRDSAREMAIATKSYTTVALGYLIIAAGMIVAGLVLFTNAATGDKVLAGTIVGYLFSEMKQVTTFYFGSTRGSSQKNDTIARLMK